MCKSKQSKSTEFGKGLFWGIITGAIVSILVTPLTKNQKSATENPLSNKIIKRAKKLLADLKELGQPFISELMAKPTFKSKPVQPSDSNVDDDSKKPQKPQTKYFKKLSNKRTL